MSYKIGQKPAYSVYEERETYRDLCEELVQALNEICGVTDSPKAYKIALLAITKAEALLGDKNGR